MNPFDEYLSLMAKLGYSAERLKQEPRELTFIGRDPRPEVLRLQELTRDHLPEIEAGAARLFA